MSHLPNDPDWNPLDPQTPDVPYPGWHLRKDSDILGYDDPERYEEDHHPVYSALALHELLDRVYADLFDLSLDLGRHGLVDSAATVDQVRDLLDTVRLPDINEHGGHDDPR